jgi:hypothetical protein
MRAKQKGRSLDHNPFSRRAGKANARKAAEWAEGWHAATVRVVQVPSDWRWPPLRPIPNPPAGDYWLRERGLLAYFRPTDLVEYDVLLAEIRCGMVGYLPGWSVVPYDLMAAYAATRGRDMPVADSAHAEPRSHPLMWLWTAYNIQRSVTHWPPLLVNSFEEMIYGTVPEALLGSGTTTGAAGSDGDDAGE